MTRALLLLAAACDAATPDPGLGRALFVDGAQFRPGRFPAATGGPATLSLDNAHDRIVAGANREPLHGVLGPSATAAIIGIDGRSGTWIVPAGPPDIETPGDASLRAIFGLNEAFPPEPFTLLVAAVDAAGKIGEPQGLPLLALPYEPPAGALVIGLVWQNRADLDLHVIDPLGNEIWRRDPSSYHPVPGEPPDPNAWKSSGILDRDANADCVLGGVMEEDVIWTTRDMVAPIVPPGTYTVRVDTHSLCGEASAPWLVFATHLGDTIQPSARGIATPDDEDLPHDKGAGTTAATFTIQ